MARYLIEAKKLIALGLPLILAQLAQVSLGFTDTLMVGRLGKDALAAIALASSYYFTSFIIFMGVLIAIGPVVGQAIGANDDDASARAVRQGLWLAVLMAPFAITLLLLAKFIFLKIGQNPEIVAFSYAYLKAMAWGILPALMFVALRSLLEGSANTKPIFIFALISVAVNVFFNYLLIFGNLGFPKLGLVGSAYASSIVNWLSFLFMSIYVSKAYKKLEIFAKLRQPDYKTLKEIMRLGVPISMSIGAEVGLFTAAAMLMGLLGKDQLAAHQIALQTASITFMVPLGLSIAISIRVGQAVGRNDYLAARHSGVVGIIVSTIFMAFTALSFWFLPKQIVSLYLDASSPENLVVAKYAMSFLSVAAMFQLFDGLQVSATGALRGFKDTEVPMFITIFAYWLIGLSGSAILAFWANLGGRGLWLGLVLGLGVSALLLNIRFFILSKRTIN
ncbi:MAG TPA: MATE family efflux transporter [Trueperaceae bacterium]|nr:MATE family efflux transporter [Trueperaceae bacterium]